MGAIALTSHVNVDMVLAWLTHKFRRARRRKLEQRLGSSFAARNSVMDVLLGYLLVSMFLELKFRRCKAKTIHVREIPYFGDLKKCIRRRTGAAK